MRQRPPSEAASLSARSRKRSLGTKRSSGFKSALGVLGGVACGPFAVFGQTRHRAGQVILRGGGGGRQGRFSFGLPGDLEIWTSEPQHTHKAAKKDLRRSSPSC